jgi:hypothetical protein
MRTIAMLIAATMCVVGAPMELTELRTADGRLYENVRVTKVEPDGISIRHDSGTAKIRFEKLSPEMQTAFGYDAEDAAHYRQAQALKDAENERSVAELGKEEKRPSTPASEREEAPAEEPVAEEKVQKKGKGVFAMTAKSARAGRDDTTTWKTSYGSSIKTIDRDRVVAVTVRSLMDTESTAMLEVIWLSNRGRGAASGIAGVSRIEIPLQAREEVTKTVTQIYTQDRAKFVALGIKMETGSGYAGWVARLVDLESKKVLSCVASRPPLVRWSDRVPVED